MGLKRQTMKQCHSCGQSVAEHILSCPSCGSHFAEGIQSVDSYRILKIVHEGHASILCKAIEETSDTPVMIRLFTSGSGVDDRVADRLARELSELKKLPPESFVQHRDIRQSSQGLWYRVSEWVDAENWGSLLASGPLKTRRVLIDLFRQIASALAILHERGHFIPHLILNDIMVVRDAGGTLRVKIDYKLSRFLDPSMDRPGPMLKKLLSSHPDIINGRALDFRTDIWSLGKVFVELLTADLDIVDCAARIDGLGLDRGTAFLLKVMLADDPDLRPDSMSDIVGSLTEILNTLDSPGSGALETTCEEVPGETRQLKKIIWLLVLTLVTVVAAGGLGWVYLRSNGAANDTVFSDFAETYAGSVAFVMVEYWAQEGKTVVYRNRIEGTAFLADADGYLLTNRHIACPWLEDMMLINVFSHYKMLGRDLQFSYRMFLWFEGEKAFNRLPALVDSSELSDRYYLASAHGTDQDARLSIAGIPRGFATSQEKIKAPFKDDFAVLKIDPVPADLIPLPLARNMDPHDIPRLSPVITLGFPLGSQTQADSVNVSVTRGHVRRTFQDIIQVDSSIYMGNSGGPVVDAGGRVIGIATAVATQHNPGYAGTVTPLSDIGLILPVGRAVGMMDSLKKGEVKWNGVLDFALLEKLDELDELALSGRWHDAIERAEHYLESSLAPPIVFAAGMLHFCTGNQARSRYYFSRALSMEQGSSTSRLMLSILDWLEGSGLNGFYARELLAMDWRSRDEFLGYLASVLKYRTPLKPGYSDWETRFQKSWRLFIAGLVLEDQAALEASADLYKEAVFSSSDDNWVYFLALARFKAVQDRRMALMTSSADREHCQEEITLFQETALKKREQGADLRKQLEALSSESSTPGISYEDHVALLEKMGNLDPDTIQNLASLAFLCARHGHWQEADSYAQAFLGRSGRETALRLGVGLLKGIIPHMMGNRAKAIEELTRFQDTVSNPWYQDISQCLVSRLNEKTLLARAENNPENLLTAHAALGLWAEGSGNRDSAMEHYREALGSYLDHRVEYDLALGRIMQIRNVQK